MDLKALIDMPPWDWPEDIGKRFLEILRDGQADASDRILAAEMSGDISQINDEIAEVMLAIAVSSDESEEMRCRTVVSLGAALEYVDMEGFDDPDEVPISEKMFDRIQATFRRLYMDAGVPETVRRRILEASVRAPSDWHRNAVRAAYYSNNEPWRLTAVFCMGFIPGFDKQIIEAFESINPDIVCQAVWAAGNWGVDAAWPHIAAMIGSEKTEKELLLAAIDAAINIRPSIATPMLENLVDSRDRDIADAASEALSMAEAIANEEGYDEFD